MTSFYIKTDLDVVGPFTGIEIREAALAGILRYNTFLSGTSTGPWIASVDAGLFDEHHKPKPHPPGTEIPTFQTRGMPGAFMGPFKLRELIGFACQGMLPPGTELQSDPSRPWIPITGTGILPACLRGDLVRIEENGRIFVRTVVPKDLEERREQLKTLQSPIDLARKVKAKGATAAPKVPQTQKPILKTDRRNEAHSVTQSTSAPQSTSATQSTTNDATDTSANPVAAPPRINEAFNAGATLPGEAAKQNTKRASAFTRMRAKLAEVTEPLNRLAIAIRRPRIAAMLLFGLLLFVGIPLAYSGRWRMALPRQKIIGQWIADIQGDPEAVEPDFGVTFLEDGRCVLMNCEGDCWTGDFRWIDQLVGQDEFAPEESLTIDFDTVSPDHLEAPVEQTDGYLKLSGFVKEAPQLNGHPVRDLFVRRSKNDLLVGYPTSASWVDGDKTMKAGWVRASAFIPSPVKVLDAIRDLPEEEPDNQELGENAETIPVAMERAMQGMQIDHRGKRLTQYGCFTFSQNVDAAYLLKTFGVADEARPLQTFERPVTRRELAFDGAQLIRYDNVKFITDSAGQIFYVGFDNRNGGPST